MAKWNKVPTYQYKFSKLRFRKNDLNKNSGVTLCYKNVTPKNAIQNFEKNSKRHTNFKPLN